MVVWKYGGKFTADKTPIEIECHYLTFGKLRFRNSLRTQLKAYSAFSPASGTTEPGSDALTADDLLFHAVWKIEGSLHDKIVFSLLTVRNEGRYLHRSQSGANPMLLPFYSL